MFSFGEQLYRPTIRDEQTLLVDSFFRSFTVNYGIGVGNVSTFIQIPKDRAFYLHQLQFNLTAVAADTWTVIAVTLFNNDNSVFLARLLILGDTAGLIGDNASTRGINVGPNINKTFGLVVPPSTSIEVAMTRTGGLAAATAPIFSVAGYLLPPGGIARAA
jgi:hypothetical protein